MSKPQHKMMEFVTLTTGGTTMDRRSDIADHVITKIQAGIQAGGELWAGWSVRLGPSHPTSHVYQMLLNGQVLSACFLCIDKSASDMMWEAAEQLAPQEVVLARPRGVPWLAIALLPKAIELMQNGQAQRLLELADAERSVAWALIEA
jgi:hypothetical protein